MTTINSPEIPFGVIKQMPGIGERISAFGLFDSTEGLLYISSGE
jgi:hypothetical protein